jgi:hypothetical protein
MAATPKTSDNPKIPKKAAQATQMRKPKSVGAVLQGARFFGAAQPSPINATGSPNPAADNAFMQMPESVSTFGHIANL